MDGSAADRSATAAPDDSTPEWRGRASVTWRRWLLLLAHWRLRVLVAVRLGRQALRHAWRAVLAGLAAGPKSTSGEAGERTRLPTVVDGRALPVAFDGAHPPRDQPEPAASLPGPGEPQRELPAGDGLLDVERTPSRLIISDPAAEDAYLASTYWVEVEA